MIGIDLDHRNISLLVSTDHFAFELPAVRQLDLDLISVFHHMIVRENVACSIDDDSRTETRLLVLPGTVCISEGVAKKLPEERIVEKRIHYSGCLYCSGCRYVYDCRLCSSCDLCHSLVRLREDIDRLFGYLGLFRICLCMNSHTRRNAESEDQPEDCEQHSNSISFLVEWHAHCLTSCVNCDLDQYISAIRAEDSASGCVHFSSFRAIALHQLMRRGVFHWRCFSSTLR